MECQFFFAIRLAKMLSHDSNDIQFIRFCFCCFSPLRKVFMKFSFCMAALSCIYIIMALWYLCKAVRSISAKLAVPFCLPSLYLLICFLTEIYQCVNWQIRRITHARSYIMVSKKTIEWNFRFAIEISEIQTIHIISNVSHYWIKPIQSNSHIRNGSVLYYRY